MIEKLRMLNEEQKKQLTYGIKLVIIVLYFIHMLRKENKYSNELMRREAEEETKQRKMLKKKIYKNKAAEINK